MVANPEQDFVLKTVESRDVHFVRFWFTDVLGNMKSFAVVPDELESAFEDGMGFDASCIAGFSAASESDMLAYPDPQSNAVARMICSIRTPEGEPYVGDSRHVLESVVRKAAEAGYSFIVGPELEYFYFKDAEGTEVLDRGSYFDLTSLDSASDLRRDTVLTLEKMGIPVEYSHHEKGPSQHEIDLRYADALSMADAPGNGMHVHQSLIDKSGNNAFFDANDSSGYNLSSVAKSYIAGLLKYAPEYTLVTNQYVNSYKRLQPGGEAPTCISWGARNRSTLVRIPGYRPNSESACRVELRSPDPAANPYLAFAVMLAAGLAGIEEGLKLMDPVDDAAPLGCSRHEHRERGIETLPESLGEAVERFAASRLMRETLGEHIHDYLVRAKRAEWEAYQGIVSDWELKQNLAVL